MLKEYFSIAEILKLRLEGYLARFNLETKANKEHWLFRSIDVNHSDKPVREYHISNFPPHIREKIISRLLERATKEAKLNGKNIRFAQESLNIAYSRLEIILFIRKTRFNIRSFCIVYNNRDFINNELSETVYENVPTVGERTLYRWIKSYDKLGLEGIKHRVDERKLGKSQYKTDEELNIKQLAIGAMLNKPHLKIKLIYKFLQEIARKQNLAIPSYRTICNYLEDYKKNNKQEFLLASNPDKWKSKYLLAIGSYSEEATEPNYIWELDSSPSDVMLEGGRYMILACIDVYSRRVKFLVNKTSNSLGITSLLRACMLEWGIPKIIKTDNGKDYTSQQIKIVLNEFGIEHRLANPFQGQEKPHVERVFKRFQHDFIEALPNFVGHNVAERKAIESIKSFEDRLFGKEETLFMSNESLQRFCNWWIENHYMNIPHMGIENKTPSSKLEGFIPKLPQGEQIHKLNLLLEPLAGNRTIVKKGIRVENTNYFNPMLAMHVGEKVQVRVDRFDMGTIYVFDEQNTFICEAVNYELLGEDKQAFIQKGKQIQNAVVKEVKSKTKKLIKKAQGKISYVEPIQIDLEEAIARVEEKEEQKNNYTTEQEVDEGELRYKKAKFLEDKFTSGEVTGEELKWLDNYKKTGEYIGKSERDTLKARELDSVEDKSNSINN